MLRPVRKLTLHDYDEVLELYARGYAQDEYYKRVFKTDDCYQAIKDNFGLDVQHALLFGYAYGYFSRDKKLVGFILACNFNDWRNNHVDAYNHLFAFVCKETLDWIESVHKSLRDLGTNACYIFALTVKAGYDVDIVAYALVNQLVNKYGKSMCIFSDLSTTAMTKACSRCGFVKLTAEGGYGFVVKH